MTRNSRPGRDAKDTRTKAERRVDMAYALANWPFQIGTTPIFFLAAYLNGVTGASLAVLGLISTGARIYDALYNPLVGIISDRTRTPFGRRKPWVLLGFIGMMTCLVVGIFVLPSGKSHFNPMWFAIGLAAFFTTWTTALVPYAAHSGEITKDYDRRSRMNLMQSRAGILSSLITYFVPYLLVDPDMLGARKAFTQLLPHVALFQGVNDWLLSGTQGGLAGYGRVMIVLAWMTLITSPVLVWRYMRHVPEMPIPQASGHAKGDKGSLLLPLRNPLFLWFSAGYLIFIAGYVGRLSLYPFIVPYAIGGGYSFLLLMQIQTVTAVLATPLWTPLFMRLERGQVMMIASITEAVGLLMLGMSSHGMPIMALVGSAVIGLPGGTVIMLPYLVASEAADYSRMKHGGDTRGLHTAIIGLVGKIGNFLATMVLGIAGVLGFNPSHGVSPHDIVVIKWLGLYGPVFFILVGGAMMMRFPITRARHKAIQNRLERRQGRPEIIRTDPHPLPPLPGLVEPLEIQAPS